MTFVEETAAARPAANANGTVRPSAIPITTSRTISVAVKCFSMWGVAGMGVSSAVKILGQPGNKPEKQIMAVSASARNSSIIILCPMG
jgi:hypothetical protein